MVFFLVFENCSVNCKNIGANYLKCALWFNFMYAEGIELLEIFGNKVLTSSIFYFLSVSQRKLDISQIENKILQSEKHSNLTQPMADNGRVHLDMRIYIGSSENLINETLELLFKEKFIMLKSNLNI